MEEKKAEENVLKAVSFLSSENFRNVKSSDEQKLVHARAVYRKTRSSTAPRIAVSGFNLSINAAGRVKTLTDMYRTFSNPTSIGFLYKEHGGQIWPPLLSEKDSFKAIKVCNPSELPSATLNFVRANPFDIVHLSKPRFPNILLGALYKIVWGSTVFVDIDDEELGISIDQTTLDLEEFLKTNLSSKKCWRRLVGSDGARVGNSYWKHFDGVTVSNLALQEKYGGLILPHARSRNRFKPSLASRRSARSRFGIADSSFVFLFFGTARKHKGVLETAQLLAEIGDEKILFLVAGHTEDKLLKELRSVEGLNLKTFPFQPYEHIPEIVGIADACVLLQSEKSLTAKYQLPAKLIDALAMEVLVLAVPTPAIRDIVDAGCVVPVSQDTIHSAILASLKDQSGFASVRRKGRQYFDEKLSVEACSPLLENFVAEGLLKSKEDIETFPAPLREMLSLVDYKSIERFWSQLGNYFLPKRQ